MNVIETLAAELAEIDLTETDEHLPTEEVGDLTVITTLEDKTARRICIRFGQVVQEYNDLSKTDDPISPTELKAKQQKLKMLRQKHSLLHEMFWLAVYQTLPELPDAVMSIRKDWQICEEPNNSFENFPKGGIMVLVGGPGPRGLFS